MSRLHGRSRVWWPLGGGRLCFPQRELSHSILDNKCSWNESHYKCVLKQLIAIVKLYMSILIEASARTQPSSLVSYCHTH